MNAIATEMLDTSVAAESGSARDVIRARAVARGLLHSIEGPESVPPSTADLAKAFRSVKLTAAELLDDQRGAR